MSADDYGFEVQAAGEVFRYLVASEAVRVTLCAWLDANGVDHREVCVPQRAVIADGKLTVLLYELNEAGHRFVRNEGDNEAAKLTVTVPLMEALPECWFERRPA